MREKKSHLYVDGEERKLLLNWGQSYGVMPSLLKRLEKVVIKSDKDVLVCMEICKGLRYNSDVGNKQDILICKEETVP